MLRNIFTFTRLLMLPFSLFGLVLMSAFQANAQDRNSLPDLSGEKAVGFLKDTDQYDSLVKAVKSNTDDKGAASTENALSTMQKLIASDGAAEDYLGYSVSISGNFAVVGAPYDNDGINPNVGSVYVFEKVGSSWTFNAKLKPFDGAADDNFGWSVDIDDDLIIVGSPNDDVSFPNQGSAYVWRGIAGFGWNPEGKIVASDGQAGDQFGYRVAASDNSIAISAPLDDYNTLTDKGSVYVYVGLTQQAKFSPPDVASGDRFGNTVDISGNFIIAGSPGDDIDSKLDQGSAHIFNRIGTGWNHDQKLVASDGSQYDNFGAWVAIKNELAVVGAPGDDVNGNHDQGSAYLFETWGSEYTLKHYLVASDGAADDQFGRCVAVSGSNIVVGAYKADVDGKADQGAAYRFTYIGDGAPIGVRQKITASDGAAGDGFGISVAVDNSTFIFGSYLDDIGSNDNQGSAYIRTY